MKYLFITPLVLLSLALTVSPVHSMNLLCGFVWLGCETVTKEELFRKDGLYYKKFTDIPFTGNVEGEWQGAFKKGKKSGSWVQYWDNGQLMEKGTYVDESPEGFWVRYYENGQLMEKGNLKKGLPDGVWVTYHDNGQLHSKTDFKKGSATGFSVRYYENGQIEQKGHFKNNEKEGFWEGYNKDGTVNTVFHGTYKNGVRVGD